MSESALPLPAQGGADAAPVEETEPGDKRRLLLISGVAALLVLAGSFVVDTWWLYGSEKVA